MTRLRFIVLLSCLPLFDCATKPANNAVDTTANDGDTVKLFADVSLDSKQPRGQHKLTRAFGVWHYRITERKGRAIKIEYVQPTGLVQFTYTITYGPTSHTITERNPVSVVLWEREIHDDGLTTIQYRDESFLDIGCAARRFLWDSDGWEIGSQCLDANNDPMPDKSGCLGWSLKRDEHHDIVSNHCELAPGTKPSPKFIAETHFTSNSFGHTIEMTFYGTNGARVPTPSGCMGVRQRYDAAQNMLDWMCVDADGDPFEGTDHLVIDQFKYDANGCEIEMRFNDARGLRQHTTVPAVIQFTRTPNCYALSEIDYTATGERLNTAASPASEIYKYDENLDLEAKGCGGAQGEAVSCEFPTRQGDAGSIVLYRRDVYGRVLSETCFTVDGKKSGCGSDMPHERRFDYDDKGFEVSHSFFDDQGHPASRLGTLHRVTYEYDDSGFVTVERSFDVQGKPTVISLGYSIIVYTYGERHRLRSIETQDTRGVPVVADMCIAGRCFATGASRVDIVYDNGVHNVYRAPDGKKISDVDCAVDACWE